MVNKDKQDKLTKEDFNKAVEALRKAHIPGPYKAITERITFDELYR